MESKIDLGTNTEKGIIDVFTGRLKNFFIDGKSCFTHYQPITKPQPPIY